MRKIKFRGKKALHLSWEYGLLCHHQDGSLAIERKERSGWYSISVIPETIGQFTGCHDKNGKEIYDGDQIGAWNMVGGKKVRSRLQVFWNEATAQWCVDLSADQDKSYCDTLWTELRDFEYEIVGNIHENPELLN